jgi:hypothetical protein
MQFEPHTWINSLLGHYEPNALYSKSSLINLDIWFYSQIESKDHIEVVKM